FLPPATGGFPHRSGDRSQVRGLGALLPLGHVELDLLVLLEVPVAGSRDRREVDEHVRATLLGDEAIPLLGVEPLHDAGCHTAIPSFPGRPGFADPAAWAPPGTL